MRLNLLLKSFFLATGLLVGANATWAQISTIPYSTGFSVTEEGTTTGSVVPFVKTAGDGALDATTGQYLGEDNYLLRFTNCTAVATFDTDAETDGNQPYTLAANEIVTISYTGFHGYLNTTPNTTFSVINSDGSSLLSYTYNHSSCKITDVKLGGVTPASFTEFSIQSTNSKGTSFNQLSQYTRDEGANGVITVKIGQNGSVSINFVHSVKKIDNTYSATLEDYKMDLASLQFVTNCTNDSRSLLIDDLSLTTETKQQYTYTVNSVCDGEIIGTAGGSGDESAQVAISTAPIWVAGQKYIYVEDNSATNLINSSNNAVITVTYRKASVYSYVIKAVDEDDNVLQTLVSGDDAIEGENKKVAWSKYIYANDQWYVTSTSPFTKTITDNVDETVKYSKSDIAYFFESENLNKTNNSNNYMTTEGNDAASGGNKARLARQGYHWTPALNGGVYSVSIPWNNSNSSSSNVYVYIRDTEGNFTKTDLSFEATNTANTFNCEVTIPDGYSLALHGDEAGNANNNARMDYIILTLVRPLAESPSVTDYATFSSPYALDFEHATGVKAYVAKTSDGTTVTMEKVTGTVKENTGLLLQKTEGDISIPTAATGTDLSAKNLLKPGTGAEVKTEGTTHRYVLAGEGDATSFYELTTAYVVPVGKAYLEVENAGARLSISFSDGESVGITSVEQTNASAEGIYNLNGQRVVNPTKGLYIVNGKKVIKK